MKKILAAIFALSIVIFAAFQIPQKKEGADLEKLSKEISNIEISEVRYTDTDSKALDLDVIAD